MKPSFKLIYQISKTPYKYSLTNSHGYTVRQVYVCMYVIHMVWASQFTANAHPFCLQMPTPTTVCRQQKIWQKSLPLKIVEGQQQYRHPSTHIQAHTYAHSCISHTMFRNFRNDAIITLHSLGKFIVYGHGIQFTGKF